MLEKDELFALRDRWYARAKEQTLETLPGFITELAAFEHDYNTICYATGAAAVGAAWTMDRTPHGGITGFQGGAIMWEFMEHWNHVTAPAWLLKGEDMLYPQYEDRFNSISPETWKWLQEEAGKKLVEKDDAHADVRAHWRSIRDDGVVPFGYKVRSW